MQDSTAEALDHLRIDDVRNVTGVSARQVNNWTRGRAAVPRWAALLACVLQQVSADSLSITLEETTARAVHPNSLGSELLSRT